MCEIEMSFNLLFDSGTAKILRVLYDYQDIGITLTDIRDEAHVSYSTMKPRIPLLESLGIIVLTRRVGNAKLYMLNSEDEVVKKMVAFYLAMDIRRAEVEVKRQEGKG